MRIEKLTVLLFNVALTCGHPSAAFVGGDVRACASVRAWWLRSCHDSRATRSK